LIFTNPLIGFEKPISQVKEGKSRLLYTMGLPSLLLVFLLSTAVDPSQCDKPPNHDTLNKLKEEWNFFHTIVIHAEVGKGL